MVTDFVEIGNCSHRIGNDVTFIGESLQSSINANVFSFFRDGFDGGGVNIAVDPLHYFGYAGSVVDFVKDVGCLLRDAVDLADEGDLRSIRTRTENEPVWGVSYLMNFCAIDFEICLRV